jgi:indolepyruvate ferredoxin oxidoreductase
VERNLQAFAWGRKYYEDAAWVESLLTSEAKSKPPVDRVAELKEYQDAAYTQSYSEFLDKIPEPQLREVVGIYLYKLMAYKDEYEVARLLTKPEFERGVRDMWECAESVSYNLHPPLLRNFGLRKKMKLGPWFRKPLLVLKSLRKLRGTPLDVFGYSSHRRQERALIQWYRDLIEQVVHNLRPDNLQLALEIAALPDQIRGYEAIKEQSIANVKKLATEKLKAMKASMAVASA